MSNYLVVKGKAGMGNRILSILDSIIYAEITNRKLIIDWSDYAYSNDGSNSFPHLFDSGFEYSLNDISESDSVYPVIWKNNLSKSVNDLIDENETPGIHHNKIHLPRYAVDISKINYTEKILVRWAFSTEIYKLKRFLVNNWNINSSQNITQKLSEILQNNLRPSDVVKKRVSDFSSLNFSQPMIGVHIRYTDRKTTLKQYPKIIDRLLKLNVSAKIFLATDNLSVEKTFFERYGSEKVIVTSKWFPKEQKYIHQNPECPDRLENGIQALTDMYLLANCNYLLCDSESTFAVVSALLSNIPKDNIIDISKFRPRAILKRVKGVALSI